MAARKRRELFTIVETDPEREPLSDSVESAAALDLRADVKWFEIPFRKRDSDEDDDDDDGGGAAGDEEEEEEEEGDDDDDEEEEEEDEDDDEDEFGGAEALAAADTAGYVAGGGCNIILVTDGGAKQEAAAAAAAVAAAAAAAAEDEFYGAHNNNYNNSRSSSFSESASNDSDIDFSDLEEQQQQQQEEEEAQERARQREREREREDCAAPHFWGEPEQLVSIEPFCAAAGPRHALGEGADARDYFRLLFPDSLFEHMVEQTNNYALYRQRRSGRADAHWHPTNVREMQAYVGLNVLMGINQLPDYGMYWATDIFIGNAGFKKTMTARRFEKLNQNIQLCDREAEPARGRPARDALYKVRPLLDAVRATMWEAYAPNRCLTIDAGALPVKGRFCTAQYMPSKPVRKGLKVWMLCDSKSGYCHRAAIGVARPGEDAEALGYRVVTSLVKGLEGKHHHLFMDSFFTSARLLQRLLRDGLYACGTTQQSRRGFPDALKLRNVGKLAPGDFFQCQHGNIVATVVRDAKVVSCLSSNCTPGIVGICQSRGSDGPSFGMPRPLPLLLYQENMRGVDLCDQLRECYQVGRPCKKWWRYFLWFFINLCIVNAYIVMRESRGGAPPPGFGGKQFTQRHFRVRLAQQLIGDYQGARGMERAARKRHADSPVEYGHRLERMSERSRRCRNCTNKGLRHESVFGCKICNVHLCRGGCFSEFHK